MLAFPLDPKPDLCERTNRTLVVDPGTVRHLDEYGQVYFHIVPFDDAVL